jgi:hypothetical protein
MAAIRFRHEVEFVLTDFIFASAVKDWCEETLGNRYVTWNVITKGWRQIGAPHKFRFRYKKDAMLFTLKWL